MLRFSFCLFLVAVTSLAQGQSPKNLSSVADVYAAYPDRLKVLFGALDLARPGLEKVSQAVSRGEFVVAGEELLAYYKAAQRSSFFSYQPPQPPEPTISYADSIRQDLFNFYDLPDRVPRLGNGQLNWSFEGPDNDIEWAWGLNRHGHLSILTRAYLATGNAVFAQTVDDHLKDWTVSSFPYPEVKSSTAMWRGLEVALRAKVWVRTFFTLVNSGHLSPAAQILMLASIPDHAHYMKNFHAPAGNWLTMELSGLAMVATAWPEFKGASEWVAYAKERMNSGLHEQIYPDGIQKELTSHYHQVALYNFEQFKEICDEAGEALPADYIETLEKMNNYVAYSLTPLGTGVLNNDSDTRENREPVMKVAEKYGREDWTFIATNGKKGKRPEGNPSVMFPWAGQLVMRSDFDADAHWAFFDVGPWGTGHQHSDKLHLSVAAYGRDLLVDGGRFAYRGELADRFRGYATGSESHNVILIDGKGQAPGPREINTPVSESSYRITDRFAFATGSFDQFGDIEGKAVHNRSVFYVRNEFWVVVDRVETDRPRKIEALWHWHPRSVVAEETGLIASTQHEKGNLKIIPAGHTDWKLTMVKGQENPIQGWYSARYNNAEPAPVSVYSTGVKNSAAFVWVLQPSLGKEKPLKAEVTKVSDHSVLVSVADDEGNQWEVTVPFSNASQAAYAFTPALEASINRPGLLKVEEAGALLARLNLNHPGLERVRNAKGEPEKAIGELLAYYRSRNSVSHPVEKSDRSKSLGKAATDDEMKRADDALRHVFIGQGAYPPFYCGDDINWGYRPVPDNEWVWQLNRMGFWEALGRAYWHTGDEKYAKEWSLQLVDWTQKNPRDKEHAYAWRSIEAGIRGHRWTELFQRFIDSPAFTDDVLVAFLNSCYDHAEFLMTSYRKGSNWGLMEAEGMGFIAMTFPEFLDSERWRTESFRRLNAEIDNQVYADGHQRELAMGYHMGCIGWFMRTYDMAKMNGVSDVFPPRYAQVIERMCEVPFKLGMPDGTSTQFGDAWQGQPGHLWPRLLSWGEQFGREDFKFVATGGKEGKEPDSTAFAMKASGFYSMRSGWDRDAICFVLKCGPDGGAHCQPDNGTFELYAGGRNLMPDAGSYIYSGDPEGRAWFRQTRVHQTLTLNGENTRYRPRNLLWKPGKDLDVLVIENEGYTDLTHRRAVFFVDKTYFVIVDEAIGAGAGDVDIHFQLAPAPAVFDSTRMQVRTDFSDGWNVLVSSVPVTGMQLAEEEGWVSFKYTQKEPRPAFRFRQKKTKADGVRFVTVVVPYKGTNVPKVDARVTGKPNPGSSSLKLRVAHDGKKRRIGYELP